MQSQNGGLFESTCDVKVICRGRQWTCQFWKQCDAGMANRNGGCSEWSACKREVFASIYKHVLAFRVIQF